MPKDLGRKFARIPLAIISNSSLRFKAVETKEEITYYALAAINLTRSILRGGLVGGIAANEASGGNQIATWAGIGFGALGDGMQNLLREWYLKDLKENKTEKYDKLKSKYEKWGLA
ncbi:MAG: hypothetical protein KC516_03745 [Nanoarchaeota archaeon]|nr:hypothetical protein [Nanoarchaeota archaeon]